jgi:enediyne polyketide synthase
MVTVGFDWDRVTADGALERVATTQIQMTWARVIAHGVVTPEPYPSYLDRFFREFAGATDDFAQRNADCYRTALERIGASLWRTRPGPAAGLCLAEQRFATFQNDGNLVGNLYYTKYYELQGILRDSYLFGVIPEAYHAAGKTGGIRCLYTEVQHLRDAMPFDVLTARMHLLALHEKGMELAFEFFRLTPGNTLEKLATGMHVAAWMETVGSTEFRRIVELPGLLREHLLDLIARGLLTGKYRSAA